VGQKMSMAEILWPTIGVVCVLLILFVGLRIVRSRAHAQDEYDDPVKSARSIAQAKDMEKYIRQLKEKEHEAWSQVMTVMKDEDRDLQTTYMKNMAKQEGFADDDNFSNDAPLTELQKAFFVFWKIPANKTPATREEGNRFIKAYKAKLKTDGYAHRVRRWERLEVLMGRFYSDYNVEQLNEKCEQLGLKKTILELLLGQTMIMLSKNVLGWRIVAAESAYQKVVAHLDARHPKLELDQYKRSL
jgi:hypothetical protein